MKKSRYTEEQIIGILKQSEAGVKTAELLPGARDLGGDVSMAGSRSSAVWT